VGVAASLACGGIPIPGMEATEPPATDDGAAATDTDVPVVPVPVDSGVPAAEPAPAEPAEPAPAEPAPAEPAPEPSPQPGEPKPKPAEPSPTPKPAEPKPEPDEEPAPKPVTGPKGTVKVEGPGRVVLFNQELGRFTVPGDVPVGSFVIRVKFGDKPVVATGRVKVTEAGVTIKCNEQMGLCRGQ
jgi:hypothetical protein